MTDRCTCFLELELVNCDEIADISDILVMGIRIIIIIIVIIVIILIIVIM